MGAGEVIRALVRRLLHLSPEKGPERRERTYDEATRRRIEPGDVLLWEGSGPIAAAIRWKTGSYRTHAGIVDRMLFRQPGQTSITYRMVVISSREFKGVVVEPLSALLKRGERIAWFSHLAPQGTEGRDDDDQEQREQDDAAQLPKYDAAAAVQFAWDRWGDPYDYGTIVRFARTLLPWSKPLSPVDGEPLPRSAICSAFVAAAARAGGRDLVRAKADAVTSPGDLETSALLRYEGELVPPPE